MKSRFFILLGLGAVILVVLFYQQAMRAPTVEHLSVPTTMSPDPSVPDACLESPLPPEWSARSVTQDSISLGNYRVYEMTLTAGTEYRLQACGEAGILELDLLLFDTDGWFIVEDGSHGRQATLVYTPSATEVCFVSLYVADAEKPPGGAPPEHKVTLTVTYR